jgi:hypothetical protein
MMARHLLTGGEMTNPSPRFERHVRGPAGAAAAFAIGLALAAPSRASADSLHGDRSGGITKVTKGVWELDVGALALLTRDSAGDAAVTRLTTDLSGAVNYFVADNLSLGAIGLMSYVNHGNDESALMLGGAVGATAHLRLGNGAFLRPGLALGALFGNRELPVGTGLVAEASQAAFTARLRLPIAYYINRQLHLEGGPQLNFSAGSFTPEGGESTSFTTLDGGFAVGAGYSF